MARKNEYTRNAYNTARRTVRFMGYYQTKKEAQAALLLDEVLMEYKRPVDHIEALREERGTDLCERRLAAVTENWAPDKPNKAQKAIFRHAHAKNETAVHQAVDDVHGMVQRGEIETSAWAVLYKKLDEIAPREPAAIPGWD